MERNDYFPNTLVMLREFLALQVAQWPAYGSKLGLTPAQVTAQVASITAQINEIDAVLKMQADLAKAVETRNQHNDVFAVAYRLAVRRYKLLPGVDEAIFKAFGWVGDTAAKADVNAAQPHIGHVTVLPGLVELDFVRKGYDGVDGEYSTTGAGDWTRGEFDNRSPYEDRRPNQVPGQPETRYYRFRYRLQGTPVGQYSEVTSVVVGD